MKRDRTHPARRLAPRHAAGPASAADPDPAVGGAEAFLDRLAIVEAGGGVPHGWIAVAAVLARVALAGGRTILGGARSRQGKRPRG